MMEETKNLIYMTLDLLNSISKTSGVKSNFINIDEDTLKKVRSELFELMKEDRTNLNGKKVLLHKVIRERDSVRKNTSKKTEVIGLLPSILIDKEKFPKNEDIAKLAEQSLNLEIPFWGKRSRNEIIGNLIAMIAKKEDKELDLFYEAWKEFTNDESIHIEKWENVPVNEEDKNVKRQDFVDIWLEFFNHYKG